MFAPNGYCLIEALEDRVRSVLREVEAGPELDSIGADDPSYEVKRLNLLAQFESALILQIRRYTINALEEIESLSICSPAGLVLKISKAILTPHSEFAESKLIALAQDQNLRFVLLSEAWLIKEGQHFRSLQPTYTDKAFDQLHKRGDPERRLYGFTEPFRPFVGWSLVFKEDDLPSTAGLKRLIGADIQDANGGRPEKKSRALRAFDKIFPDGRQSTPWKIVKDAVSKAIEEDVAIITIQRAINERSKAAQNSE